ncbi:MAG: nitroreductase family protein [Eubacteriales bacterium]|nr:nitroreductase family protein [Eubacteriales bacterium]
MLTIDQSKCIGCGQCVKDCFGFHIVMEEKKAVELPGNCMACGHCVAVCPSNAISLDGHDMTKVIEKDAVESKMDADAYLNHLKLRRSIRQFKKEEVSKEDLEKIIEAGRYSPTGGNMQNVQYIVIKDQIQTVKDQIMEELNKMGEEFKTMDGPYKKYGSLWINMYENYKKNGTDKVFFNTDSVILVASNTPQSAIISAAHMETMIYALDLGMVYSGFTCSAVMHSKELQKLLNLKEGYTVHAALVLGHPDVTYRRSVPRKDAVVKWK